MAVIPESFSKKRHFDSTTPGSLYGPLKFVRDSRYLSHSHTKVELSLNLKIRVADSAVLPPIPPSLVETDIPEKLRAEVEAAPETIDSHVSDDGKAEGQVVEEEFVSAALDSRQLSVADRDEVSALSNDFAVSKSASADFVNERPADKVALAAEPVEMEDVPTPREKSLLSIAVSQRPVVKPPIIDLPSTRNHDAHGDMAELDSEISELRRALSSKLSVQNEQLRHLLQRFPD